jgi:hypothetical protein
VFAGFLAALASLFGVVLTSNRILNGYYDLYVERTGLAPDRAQRRREIQELAESSAPNPLQLFKQLIRHWSRWSQWQPLAWIFTPSSDPQIERRRFWAELAFAALPGWFIVAAAVIPAVDALFGGPALPREYLRLAVVRSVLFAIGFTWAVQYGLAKLREAPRGWQRICLIGAIAGFLAATVFWFLAA